MRRNQFTVSAESVQGNAGAEVTFKAILVSVWNEYRTTPMNDSDMLKAHMLSWVGIVDDHGKPLPSPADDPEALDKLYLHEQQALALLLFQGPDGPEAKN